MKNSVICECKEVKLKELKALWEELVDRHKGPVYLTYDYYCNLFRAFRIKRFLFRKGQDVKFICHVDRKDGKIDVIAPFLIDHRNKMIKSCGELSAAGYNDVICASTVSAESIQCVFQYIKSIYSSYMVDLIDIKEDSILRTIETGLICSKYRPCYKVKVTDGYEGWRNSLSKNRKSAINVAYNRLKVDKRKYCFYMTEKPSFLLKLKCSYVYRKRLSEILGTKKSKFVLRIESLIYAIMDANFVFSSQMKRERLAYLTIDDKIASILIGYQEADGYIFPKQGFDSDYARYSPGMVLFIETLRCFETQKREFALDLSRDWHQYKESYGAKEYFTYSLSTDKSECL